MSASTVGVVLHDVWHGLAASPLGLAAAAGLVTVAVVSAARQARWKSLPRDPVRRFARADKALILARAGGRCEYHGLLTGRCHVSEGLEADHVHPHRRGGRTDLSNGQALCRRHNRSKHAHVPYVWQLNQLAKHRAEYYPPGGTAHCQPTHPAPATTAPWIA